MLLRLTLVLFALLSIIQTAPAEEVKRKPVDYNTFHKLLQKNLSLQKPDTSVQQDDYKKELTRRLYRVCTGLRVSYKCEVSDVVWSDSFVSIKTTKEQSLHQRDTGVVLWKADSFDVIMSKDEAKAIKKGSILYVDAKVSIKPMLKYPVSNTNDGQFIFRPYVVGLEKDQHVLFSTDYTLRLRKKDLEPRWAQ